MLYTEDFTMHHYVGFLQIGSHIPKALFCSDINAVLQIVFDLQG